MRLPPHGAWRTSIAPQASVEGSLQQGGVSWNAMRENHGLRSRTTTLHSEAVLRESLSR